MVMAIGKLTAPIDFQSIDGRPVSLIWLLTSPPDKTGPHIHALARISRLMTIDKFRQALGQAKTAPGNLSDVIVQQENAACSSPANDTALHKAFFLAKTKADSRQVRPLQFTDDANEMGEVCRPSRSLSSFLN